MDNADMGKALEAYLMRPENQKLIQEEQMRKLERASKKRVYQIGVEISKCDQATQKLLGPIWKNQSISSILNSLLSDGKQYGATFQDRLYHPQVRTLLQKCSSLHLEGKDPGLENLCEDWFHHVMKVQEEEQETKPKPKLDAQSLVTYVNAASASKSEGTKAYKAKNYQEAFKCYSNGVTMLAAIEPNQGDKAIVEDLLFALYKNQAAAGLHVGELGVVLKACNKVLEHDSFDVKSLYRRGMVYYRQDQADLAMKDWKQVLRLDPDNDDAKKMLRKLDEDATKAEEMKKRMFKGIESKKAKGEADTTPTKLAAEKLPIRMVVLNLYGTLVQINKKLTPSPLLGLLQDAEVNPDRFRPVIDVLLTQNFGTHEQICEAIPQVSASAAEKFSKGVEQEVASVSLLPGVLEALSALRDAGYGLCLAANTLSPYASVVQQLGLDEYFAAVFLSCEVGVLKPQAGMYQLVLTKLGLKAGEVLWCGDNRAQDVAPPERLGMDAVHFNGKDFPNGAAAVCSHLNVALS